MTLPFAEIFPGGGMISSAVISGCETYRYELTRRWNDGDLLDWVMLNPSTADGTEDDPTIRRCVGYAKGWGFAGIRVTNLFAYRSPDPKHLVDAAHIAFGPDNADYLRAAGGPVTVCGWGAHPMATARIDAGKRPWRMLFERDCEFVCVGYNKDGSPKHPLYVSKNAGRHPWPRVG